MSILLCAWLPLAGLIQWGVSDTNAASIITLVLLYLEFILLVRLWGHYVYQQPLLKRYGLSSTRKNALNTLTGLGLGSICLLAMFGFLGILGWVEWRSSPVLAQMILEGSLTGLGVGFAEELLFRGWLLDELERDYPQTALWISAAVFGLLHAPRGIAQVPALILLGAALVWAKRATQGRLGLSIGLHGGLVWGYYILNVGQVIQFSNQVPQWVTGVDRNPLAGLVGTLAIGAISLGMRHCAIRNRPI
ncbi:CPBP family intramembrane glutamic endopeptidase [Phormidesmis sp. 146-33]